MKPWSLRAPRSEDSPGFAARHPFMYSNRELDTRARKPIALPSPARLTLILRAATLSLRASGSSPSQRACIADEDMLMPHAGFTRAPPACKGLHVQHVSRVLRAVASGRGCAPPVPSSFQFTMKARSHVCSAWSPAPKAGLRSVKNHTPLRSRAASSQSGRTPEHNYVPPGQRLRASRSARLIPRCISKRFSK